jgi:hypothetical protein
MINKWHLLFLRIKLYLLIKYLLRCDKIYMKLINDRVSWDDEKIMGVLLRIFCTLAKKYDEIIDLEKKLINDNSLFFVITNKKLQKYKRMTELFNGTIELLIQGKI